LTVVLILRVLAIVALTLGCLLVVIAFEDPNKTAIDILARALIWAIIATIAWAVADLRQRIEP
jgi:tryptophan-rich sensory protein